jgi:hypothetical protein
MERDGLLRIVAMYPETGSLEEHLVAITDAVRRSSTRNGSRSTRCRRSSGRRRSGGSATS